ncbi:unnamed protein product, partial [Meganyctiphanes norvegica]
IFVNNGLISYDITNPNVPQMLTQNNSSWEDMIQHRFDSRRRIFKATCKNVSSFVPLENTYYGKLWYQEKYNLLICAVPKAGYTTMMYHIKSMTPKHISPRARVRYWSVAAFFRRKRLMTNRNPVRKRLMPFLNQSAEQQRGLYTERELRDKINQFLGHPSETRIHFSEFLQYVMDLSKHNRTTIPGDIHWTNYSSVCAPCSMDYDYIMKTETIEEDLLYIKDRFSISEIILGKRMNKSDKSRNSSELDSAMKYWQYYLRIPACILQKIVDLVYQDIVMFGYNLPKPLRMHVSKCKTSLKLE